jgi:hypothetical protein
VGGRQHLSTISCGLTYKDRQMLLARGELSMAARAALCATIELGGYEPFQLLEISLPIARELRDASLRLGLPALALNLTSEIRKHLGHPGLRKARRRSASGGW